MLENKQQSRSAKKRWKKLNPQPEITVDNFWKHLEDIFRKNSWDCYISAQPMQYGAQFKKGPGIRQLLKDEYIMPYQGLPQVGMGTVKIKNDAKDKMYRWELN